MALSAFASSAKRGFLDEDALNAKTAFVAVVDALVMSGLGGPRWCDSLGKLVCWLTG